MRGMFQLGRKTAQPVGIKSADYDFFYNCKMKNFVQ